MDLTNRLHSRTRLPLNPRERFDQAMNDRLYANVMHKLMGYHNEIFDIAIRAEEVMRDAAKEMRREKAK